jgi:hypothetical protein
VTDEGRTRGLFVIGAAIALLLSCDCAHRKSGRRLPATARATTKSTSSSSPPGLTREYSWLVVFQTRRTWSDLASDMSMCDASEEQDSIQDGMQSVAQYLQQNSSSSEGTSSPLVQKELNARWH